jgi:hypothetical protein
VKLRQKGLKSVNLKMTMFVFIIELGFLVMAIYRWLRGPINLLSMKHRTKYLVHTILHILDFP